MVLFLVGWSLTTLSLSWVSYREWGIVRGASLGIVSTLREAQGEAIASRFSQALYFFRKGEGESLPHYEWWEKTTEGNWEEKKRVLLSTVLDFKNSLQIRFAPSGAPSPTGTVFLLSKHGFRQQIAVSIGTGRVDLK